MAVPDRVPLARTPTPLQILPALGKRYGLELWAKRDDLTGVELSGNKVRKLEFLLAEARHLGADTVITCGGEQSNHCRATAIAARRLGMDARLLLRTADPARPPAVEGNILLDRMVGADIRFITPAEYRERGTRMAREVESLAADGRKGYVIPEGGSNALGSWGYIEAMRELAADLGPEPATLLYAAGSGGTGAGLVLGAKLYAPHVRVVGVNVCDDRAYFVNAIGAICEEAIEKYGIAVSFDRSRDVEIVDGYVGRGYAQSRSEELELIRDVARAEALFLDPVYTGKAFYGMVRELERDRAAFGRRLVFLHTGGIFGLFPKAGELAPILAS